MRLRQRATVYTCHCSGIWCSARSAVSYRVRYAWFCVWGASPGVAWKDSPPPSPGVRHRASRHTRHFFPTSWAPVQKGSRTLSPTPFAFCGSRRLWCVKPSTCVSRLLSPSLATRPPAGGQKHSSREHQPAARPPDGGLFKEVWQRSAAFLLLFKGRGPSTPAVAVGTLLPLNIPAKNVVYTCTA